MGQPASFMLLRQYSHMRQKRRQEESVCFPLLYILAKKACLYNL